MKKSEILNVRIQKIFSSKIDLEDGNKLREMLLNFNDSMISGNWNLFKETNDSVEDFINYMNSLKAFYKQTLNSILIIERRINSALNYVCQNEKLNENNTFKETNKKINLLKENESDLFEKMSSLVWSTKINNTLFYISAEICRILRNNLVHKDWIYLINIDISQIVDLFQDSIISEFQKNNINIDLKKEEIDLVKSLKISDFFMEATNLENNFNNIKAQLDKLMKK